MQDVSPLLGHAAMSLDDSLPTFRENVVVLSSRVEIPKRTKQAVTYLNILNVHKCV